MRRKETLLMNSYFPTHGEDIVVSFSEIITQLLEVKLTFIPPYDSKELFDQYTRIVQSLLKKMIPDEVLFYGESIESLDDFNISCPTIL